MYDKRFKLCSPFPAAIAAAGEGAGATGAFGTTLGANAAGWASVGASSLDAIGGQAFGIANLILQNRAWEYQKAWNEKVYEEQKMMADPAYRMNRLRLAGLNPYGDYTTPMTSAVTQAPGAEGVGNALNGLAGSLSNSTSKAFQALSTKLAFKQLELQEKQTDYGLKLTEEQINNLKSNTSYQNIVNAISEATKDSQIRLSEAQVDKIMSEIMLNNINADWIPKRLKAEIANINEQRHLTRYNWSEYMPAMLLLAKSMNVSSIDLNKKIGALHEKSVEKIAEEIANLHSSGAARQKLIEDIESMPDGILKDFMFAFMALSDKISF